jgi:Icc-related predicted phosphoesterase
MKLLVISDLHAHNEVLDKMDEVFKQADAVVFGGDFAECFKPETGKEALERLCKKHDSIFAVLGNCDNIDFLEELENQDISVEKALVFHEGLAFAGSGGGTYFTGKTEFERTEDECLGDFDIVKNSVEQSGDSSLWNSLILVSHNPPVGDKIDSFDGEHHAGSQKFTDFIKENKPLAVVCGHIHEGTGIEKIGYSVVINPGSLGESGTYVWLEVEKDGQDWKVVNTELCKL